tara:strand:- start:64 stop:684 length:621 start_codon:yes stop_codon:yes gene_type:complete
MSEAYKIGDTKEQWYFTNGENGITVGYPCMLPIDWTTYGSVNTHSVTHGEEAKVSVAGIYELKANILLGYSVKATSNGYVDDGGWTDMVYVDVISGSADNGNWPGGSNDYVPSKNARHTAGDKMSLTIIARVATSLNVTKRIVSIGGFSGSTGVALTAINCGAMLDLDAGDRVGIYAQAFSGAFLIMKDGLDGDVEGTTASLVKVG